MQALKETPVLKFNPSTLQEVRSLYDLDKPGRMEEAIKLLEEWIQKQEHFITKKFDREYLERLLIAKKGLVERCKSKLDKLCTFRTLLPEYFGYCDIREIRNVPHYGDGMYDVITTRLTPDNHRVYILKFDDVSHLPDVTLAYIRTVFLVWEYIARHDYSAGIILVFDVRNINLMEYISKVNLSESRKMITVLQEGYGMRIKGLHYLSNSKLGEALINFTKSILPSKLGQRIYYHTTLDSLFKMVPKEVLCAEYGGNELPIADLINLWIDVVGSQEHKDYMKIVNECRTDESKRIGEKISDQYLPGSFRTLSVD